MQTIKLNEYVTDKGIFIPLEKVKDLQHKLVEIIITPSSNQRMTQSQTSDFMRFAGTMSESDAEEMNILVNECRKIDFDEWK